MPGVFKVVSIDRARGSRRLGPWLGLASLIGCSVDNRTFEVEPDGGLAQDVRRNDPGCLDCPEPECRSGEARCDSPTARVECVGGAWSDPVECDQACVDGACAGECRPGSSECAGSTRLRQCSERGQWAVPSDCPSACFEGSCRGTCRPGERRCASGTDVQVCSSAGDWGPVSPCDGACEGTSCENECTPGATACISDTEVQICDAARQWGAPEPCPFACAGAECRGECAPGARRCSPNAGLQLCDVSGSWVDQAACPTGEVCEDGNCACPDGGGRCDGQCVSLASDVAHCGSCDNACVEGRCADGTCQPAVLASGQSDVSSLAMSDTHLFFRQGTGSTSVIRRVPKMGGAVQTLVSGLSDAGPPALSEDQIYVVGVANAAGSRRVFRADLDGAGLTAFSPPRAQDLERVIVPGLFVYYTLTTAASTSIFRARVLSSTQGGAGSEAPFETSPAPLSSMAVVNGCLFYVTEQSARTVLRTCDADAPAVARYVGEGPLSFNSIQMNDDTYLYLLDEGRGIVRMPLAETGAVELISADAPGVPSVGADALYYFRRDAPAAAGVACGNGFGLYRQQKVPGSAAPERLLPPPVSCPTRVVVDDDALYWSSADSGEVLRRLK